MRRTRSPWEMFSPSSGSLNSITAFSFLVYESRLWQRLKPLLIGASFSARLRCVRTYAVPPGLIHLSHFYPGLASWARIFAAPRLRGLSDCRICLVGIDSQFLDRSFYHVGTDFLFARQRAKSCKHDVLGIYFKEVAQSGAAFAAAEAVGAERDELSGHPLTQAFRQHFHVIGGCDKWSRSIFQHLRDIRDLGRFGRMEHVPALAIIGVAIKLLVAGDAPDVGADVVFLFQNLLRL